MSALNSEIAVVDIETSDPYLNKFGPGAVRGLGKILGIGIYCPSRGIDDYYSPDDPVARNLLKDGSLVKVFHNGVYDLQWLVNGPDHFEVNGRIEDTMTREALLDSYAEHYDLDSCCQRRGLVGKNKGDTIDDFWARNGGKGKAISNLDKIPRQVVGMYCRQDCRATYHLFLSQIEPLQDQNLEEVNTLECRLYPFLIALMGSGFRLDWDKRTALSESLNEEYNRLTAELTAKYGPFNINSAADLANIWRKEGIPIEYTSSGKPSFASGVMEKCKHPLAHTIQHMKAITKCLTAFVDGAFVDCRYNGRIYSSFYPMKRDEGGTVTGRWSSRDINLQQIPARDDKWGKEIRSMFIPEDGMILAAFDYKQIEYRMFAHFAAASHAPGAEHIIETFQKNPDTDYHEMGQRLMGWMDMGKAGRHLIKNFGFGSVYGMGPRSFSEKFASSLLHAHPDADPDNLLPLATSLMNEYFDKVPFVKPTQQKIMSIAQVRGYVKTVGGRRQRMPPDNGVYKLVNYLCQGSAADVMKKGLADAWDAGVFKPGVVIPHAVVHDEAVCSFAPTKEGVEAMQTLKECMANAYKLTIPIGVDTEVGPDWGHCNEDNWQDICNKVA